MRLTPIYWEYDGMTQAAKLLAFAIVWLVVEGCQTTTSPPAPPATARSRSLAAVVPEAGRFAGLTVDSANVKIKRTRVVLFTAANGRAAQMVLVDWQNVGNTPIRAVFADIVPYDASGKRVDSGADDYCIYATWSNDDAGIVPGQIYEEPDGEGFVLLSYPGLVEPASGVHIRITRTKEDVNEPKRRVDEWILPAM